MVVLRIEFVNILTMEMSVHIVNQPFKLIYISSKVKSSEDYAMRYLGKIEGKQGCSHVAPS